MKVGFMEDFRNPLPWRRPYAELYRALLDQNPLPEGHHRCGLVTRRLPVACPTSGRYTHSSVAFS